MKLPRLPPPPAQPQATAGRRDGRRETVNMNGHPGRVTIQDTDPNGATRRSPAVDRRGQRLLPRGTEARSSPICPLCARRHDLAPKPPRLLSRGQADSRCHHSPRPARRPAQAAVSRQTPPAFPNPGCPRSPLTAPARLRQRRRPQEASARAPGRRRVWPRPLPAPPPACSPLSPAPPPPSPAAAAATAAGSVTSAPAGPSLPHCAAEGGGRSASRWGRGVASGGRPRPLGAALRAGCRWAARSLHAQRPSPRAACPQAAAAGPTAGDAGRGKIWPPWAPRVGSPELTNRLRGRQGGTLGKSFGG